MRGYYPQQEESIGNMLMRFGLTLAQLKQQQQAQQQQGLAQALTTMSALGKLPPAIRENQQTLQGIDEALKGMSGGKISLPREAPAGQGIAGQPMTPEPAQSQSIWDRIKGVFGARPAQAQPMPQGKFASIKAPTKPLYGFNTKTGAYEQKGELPENAIIEKFGETEKPGNVVIDRSGKVLGTYKETPHFAPEDKEEKWSYEKKKIDYTHSLKKELENQGGGRLTGKPGEVVGFMRHTGVEPLGPDGNYTKDQIIEHAAILQGVIDPQTTDNKLAMQAIQSLEKNDMEWNFKTPEQQEAAINAKVLQYKKYVKPIQNKYQSQLGGKGQAEPEPTAKPLSAVEKLKKWASDPNSPYHQRAKEDLKKLGIQ